MSRSNRKRLGLRRETLRRLASGELGQVAGGLIARCTYEKSGCYGQVNTWGCTSDCVPDDGGGVSRECL